MANLRWAAAPFRLLWRAVALVVVGSVAFATLFGLPAAGATSSNQSSGLSMGFSLDPRDWAESIVEWFNDKFEESTEAMIKGTVDRLKSVPFPDFQQDWISYLIGNMFTLVFTILTLLIVVMALIGMVFQRWIPQAARAFYVSLALFLFNNIMLIIVTALEMFSASMTKWADLVASSGGDNEDWTEDLLELDGLSDLIGSFFAYLISYLLGWVMKIEAYILVATAYAAMIILPLTFLTLAFSRRARGGKFFRWTIALLLTSVLGKPLMVATLGVGAVTVRELPGDPVIVVVVHLLAIAVPIVLFVLMNMATASVLDGHLTVDIDNEVKIDEMPPPEPEQLQKVLSNDLDASMAVDTEGYGSPSAGLGGKTGKLVDMMLAHGGEDDEASLRRKSKIAQGIVLVAAPEAAPKVIPAIKAATEAQAHRIHEKRVEEMRETEGGGDQ